MQAIVIIIITIYIIIIRWFSSGNLVRKSDS